MEKLPEEPRLTIAVEETEAAAWASLASLTHPDLPLLVQHLQGATVLIAADPEADYQNVFGLGIRQPAARQTVSQLIETYRGHGVASFAVNLCPTARPSTLRRWLLDSGFKLAGHSALILRRTANLDVPPPYHPIRDATLADAEAIGRILAASGVNSAEWTPLIVNLIGQPDWRICFSLENSQPVSMGGLFLRGEFAWQAPIWTLPDARNRGAQAELIGHCLTQASELGAQWVTTSWRAMPRRRPRNFERHGFQLLYMRSRYVYSFRDDP
jgi:GNAT superfamily N-acetyltransferase